MELLENSWLVLSKHSPSPYKIPQSIPTPTPNYANLKSNIHPCKPTSTIIFVTNFIKKIFLCEFHVDKINESEKQTAFFLSNLLVGRVNFLEEMFNLHCVNQFLTPLQAQFSMPAIVNAI